MYVYVTISIHVYIYIYIIYIYIYIYILPCVGTSPLDHPAPTDAKDTESYLDSSSRAHQKHG